MDGKAALAAKHVGALRATMSWSACPFVAGRLPLTVHALGRPQFDERQGDRLREELTLAQIDHHAEAVDELDVQGILAFAERILPRASDLWVQASLDYTAATGAVLPGRNRVRRKSIQSNRRYGTTFQLLGAV